MDTLAISKTLQRANLPIEQADAIASAIGVSIDERAATKSGLLQVKTELEAKIDKENSNLRASLLTWFVGTPVAVGAPIVALIKL